MGAMTKTMTNLTAQNGVSPAGNLKKRVIMNDGMAVSIPAAAGNEPDVVMPLYMPGQTCRKVTQSANSNGNGHFHHKAESPAAERHPPEQTGPAPKLHRSVTSVMEESGSEYPHLLESAAHSEDDESVSSPRKEVRPDFMMSHSSDGSPARKSNGGTPEYVNSDDEVPPTPPPEPEVPAASGKRRVQIVNRVSRLSKILDSTLGMFRDKDYGDEITQTPSDAYSSVKSGRNSSKSATSLMTRKQIDKAAKKGHWRKQCWKMTAAELLGTQKFDNFVGLLIIINATTIGLQTDWLARSMSEDTPAAFARAEQIFCVLFTAELVLRIHVHRMRFFSIWQEGFAWNYFDWFVVMSQIFEVVLDMVTRNLQIRRTLRFLRIMRLVRILRLLRVLHLIGELRTIVSSILGSLKSLLWTVALLLMLIYIMAVYFTQTIMVHLLERPDGEFTEGDLILKAHFSSLGRSVLSLWQAMSGGFDWDTLAKPMLEEIGVWLALIFTGYIAFAILALMNVVTGVFVQTALTSAKSEEDGFVAEQIMSLFSSETDGFMPVISLDDIEQSMESPMKRKQWKAIGVEREDAVYLFKLLDFEGIGYVTFEDFLGGCLRLNADAKAMDLLTLVHESRKANERTGLRLCECMDKLCLLEEMVLILDGKEGSSDKVSNMAQEMTNMRFDVVRALRRLEKKSPHRANSDALLCSSSTLDFTD
eukprot:TRINITY_DN27423_c0_g1_i2.p1 TRINITY_DN27423_c0_g1~~TRINITY_DN27423_c0_g1_i2.p1  ORF type:complete len:768 (+),score=181.28 TRINITY_DN27423_c0_g1_i2:201-2306(+)